MREQTKYNVLWVGLFLIVTASLTVPFFLVREPPLLDYPNHLARTFILSHIHDSQFTFSKYYQADWKPYPYILWDVLAVALQQFLPVEMAGKLLLVVNTALVPIAVAWFLWQANRSEIKLALLGCALSYYTLFLWGFTAYQLGVSFCFLMLGTWLWYSRKPSTSRAAVFAAISVATFLAHLLGFASAAFILVLYELTAFNWRGLLGLAAFSLRCPCCLCGPIPVYQGTTPSSSGPSGRNSLRCGPFPPWVTTQPWATFSLLGLHSVY